MAFWKKQKASVQFFIALALALALGAGLSIPAWALYVQSRDLGSGGVGGEAQAGTPVAQSIAEMEALDHFAVHAVGTIRRAFTC